MRTIRRTNAPLLGLVLILLVILAACAGGAGAALSPVGGNADDGGGFSGAAPSAAASGAPAAPVPGEGEGQGSGDGVGAPIDDAKIIRTGTMELEVSDVPLALAAARDGIRAMGGYIGASTTEQDGDTPRATVTYRIPSDRWEDALALLRRVSGDGTKVITERTQAVEVTGQVIDLEARIKNLRAAETSLQKIADQATRIPDILEVQNQLTTVRGQIEQLSAQLVGLQDQTSYGTLTTTFMVPVVAVVEVQKGWDPAVIVDEASASLIDVLQSLTTAGIWFAIVWVPVLLMLAVILGLGIWIVRRLGILRPRNAASTWVDPN